MLTAISQWWHLLTGLEDHVTPTIHTLQENCLKVSFVLGHYPKACDVGYIRCVFQELYVGPVCTVAVATYPGLFICRGQGNTQSPKQSQARQFVDPPKTAPMKTSPNN